MLNCFYVLSYYLTENTRLLNKDSLLGARAYFAENSVPLSLYGKHGNLDLSSIVTMANKVRLTHSLGKVHFVEQTC